MAQVHCGSKENLRTCDLWGSLPTSPSSSCLGTLNSKKTKSLSRAQATLAGSQTEYTFFGRFALPWELATTSWSLSLGGERLPSEIACSARTFSRQRSRNGGLWSRFRFVRSAIVLRVLARLERAASLSRDGAPLPVSDALGQDHQPQ